MADNLAFPSLESRRPPLPISIERIFYYRGFCYKAQRCIDWLNRITRKHRDPVVLTQSNYWTGTDDVGHRQAQNPYCPLEPVLFSYSILHKPPKFKLLPETV